ncbi:hypothetical protein TREMEDRAFT_60451 [Tremella mesenterica DSM 1558]|uniref:uncharacterized protein n=1 Tax=Tremella mesenterica (strain ATCC 24925 / CBS 8224 / DSM 1558 / NBRC 9311 / NRRL Y-6157 / RJB 2259-6 / UBC 559-6) TaxID=578456 RepID=UPI0003F49479|nr:uncharacterized protein TREMEDRAFT_60451 [Tremella mesenterica DSM 1558]EIW71525.1 hypothetical protein TREMEDRAFT_60451 [Tremella mesenterica DSM 1558]
MVSIDKSDCPAILDGPSNESFPTTSSLRRQMEELVNTFSAELPSMPTDTVAGERLQRLQSRATKLAEVLAVANLQDNSQDLDKDYQSLHDKVEEISGKFLDLLQRLPAEESANSKTQKEWPQSVAAVLHQLTCDVAFPSSRGVGRCNGTGNTMTRSQVGSNSIELGRNLGVSDAM